jgi:superfamily I DNA and/or RNA helicase
VPKDTTRSDNLQEKIKETLIDAKLSDVLVVRSTTPEKRTTSDEEVHKAGLEYLERLADSDVIGTLPLSIQTRIKTLRQAATRLERSKDTVSRQERSGLGAISHLVLDAANIVISTANSADIERLVEAREQFDWVIVEEAAKATGPELIGPLMLSGSLQFRGLLNQERLDILKLVKRLAFLLQLFGFLSFQFGPVSPSLTPCRSASRELIAASRAL